MNFDLTLAPETIQEYAAAADRNLTCPASTDENPTFKAGKSPGLGIWTEAVKIHDTDIVPVKSDPDNPNKANFVVVLSVLGPEDGGFTTNQNRTHYQYFYIDKVGLASADPKVSGVYKRRLATINNLLAVAGVDMTSAVGYTALFTGDKPLVGMKMAAVFRKYRNQRTDENGVDIDGFLKLGS